MKRFSILSGCTLLTFLASCYGTSSGPDYTTSYKPVIMTRESLERSIAIKAPTDLKTPAKIYYKDNFILVSEHYKGVHVIDNTDPKKPISKSYISVPGCVDMAMKGNTLYVDNAVDLVAIDLSKLNDGQIEVKKRVKNVFPELVPPDAMSIPYRYSKSNRPANSVIVNWVK